MSAVRGPGFRLRSGPFRNKPLASKANEAYRLRFRVSRRIPDPNSLRAHLPVAGELAGLPERFQARSCGCTQHDVFRAAWYRPKRFFGCEGGWIFIRSGAVSGWHANFAWNGNG